MIEQLVSTSVSRRAPSPQIRVRATSRSFIQHGRLLAALGPIDLDVATGEFVCLVGPSGCGKSSLLNIIAGLDEPSAGAVLMDDEPVGGPATDRILIFQEGALFPWLDVRGNVEFGLAEAGLRKSDRRRIAQHYIDLVHLSGFERSYVHQLSGGMRQRAAIARALALDPKILLMDEPFGALDALTRDHLYAELESIWSTTRKTVIFVTHNVREAVLLGDRVLVFSPRPGRIIGEFRVDLPRPRSLMDHALSDQAAEILACLEAGLQSHAVD